MNQIKRITAFLLTFIMCLQVMAFSAFAGSKISINNIMLCLETIAIDDSAMVSLRDIYQCFGATITWQADTQEIVVENTDKTIKFKVDSATAIINDVSVSLSHAVVKQNGVTYIPINFVSTSLDIPIKWNIEDGIVEFTISPDQTQAVNDRNNKLAAEKEKQRQAKIARQQSEQERQRQAAQVTAAPQGDTVYVTKTGKKYHYDNSCNGGTYYPSTLEKAKARGLTPCKKCAY